MKLESVTIQFGDARSALIVRDGRGEHAVEIGYSTWLNGTSDVRGRSDEPIAACGAWTAEDTYEVRVCCYEDAFCPVFRFHYMSGRLQLEVDPNVSWEDTAVTTISSRVAG